MYLDWILDWNGIYFLYGIAIERTTFGTVYVQSSAVLTDVIVSSFKVTEPVVYACVLILKAAPGWNLWLVRRS